MPKRRSSKTQNTASRDKILEAAFDAFARHGYDGTTTREIADRAGVNVSAIHYHWGDKARLWEGVLDLYSQRIKDLAAGSADLAAPAHEAVPAFLDAVFDAFVEQPNLVRLNLWVTLEAETIDYEAARRRFDPLFELAVRYLRVRQEAGDLPGVDLEVAIMLISTQLIYTLAQRRVQKHIFGRELSDPGHRERIKRVFMRHALAMLQIRAPES